MNTYPAIKKEVGQVINKTFWEPLVPRHDLKLPLILAVSITWAKWRALRNHSTFNRGCYSGLFLLQEIRILRSGDDDEREVYDSTTGKFSGLLKLKITCWLSLYLTLTLETTSGATAEAISEIDKDGKLSDKAKKALGERLIREANSNTRFDPEKYAKKGGFGQEADDETIAEINDHFRSQFKYGTKGGDVANCR